MKKKQMIEELNDAGFDPEGLKWQELQKFYKEKITNAETIVLKKPDQKDVDEKLHRVIERNPHIKTALEKTREELFPKIVDLMVRLKGRTRATHGELQEMFKLYNAFYIRSDSASCGACVARVYRTFKEICKGRV